MFGKVKAYKNGANFLDHSVQCRPTSSSFRVGLKLRRNGKAWRTKTPKIDTPGVPYTPKNRPPGVRTRNPKSLTEALLSRGFR